MEQLVSDVDIKCANHYHELGSFMWEQLIRLADLDQNSHIFSKAVERGIEVEKWLICKDYPNPIGV